VALDRPEEWPGESTPPFDAFAISKAAGIGRTVTKYATRPTMIEFGFTEGFAMIVSNLEKVTTLSKNSFTNSRLLSQSWVASHFEFLSLPKIIRRGYLSFNNLPPLFPPLLYLLAPRIHLRHTHQFSPATSTWIFLILIFIIC
jgi:hypothetical protein